MLLWLDDIRAPGDHWVWVRKMKDAQEALLSGKVEYASFDHDLGWCEQCWDYSGIEDKMRCSGKASCECGCHPTGSELIRWMVTENVWPTYKPKVHSANPVGKKYMEDMIEDYGPYPKSNPWPEGFPPR